MKKKVKRQMIEDENKDGRYSTTVRASYLLKNIIYPNIKTARFSFLYTIHRNWKNIFGEEQSLYIKLNKVVLTNENKNANIYLISHNSGISFFINNNKLYFLDKINALFGYKAVQNIYIQEIPQNIKIPQKYRLETDKEKVNKFIKENNVENLIMKDEIIKLAEAILKKM